MDLLYKYDTCQSSSSKPFANSKLHFPGQILQGNHRSRRLTGLISDNSKHSKEKLSTSTVEYTMVTTANGTPVKRRLGRPRKVLNEENDRSSNVSESGESASRPRGRPHLARAAKEQKANTAASSSKPKVNRKGKEKETDKGKGKGKERETEINQSSRATSHQNQGSDKEVRSVDRPAYDIPLEDRDQVVWSVGRPAHEAPFEMAQNFLPGIGSSHEAISWTDSSAFDALLENDEETGLSDTFAHDNPRGLHGWICQACLFVNLKPGPCYRCHKERNPLCTPALVTGQSSEGVDWSAGNPARNAPLGHHGRICCLCSSTILGVGPCLQCQSGWCPRCIPTLVPYDPPLMLHGWMCRQCASANFKVIHPCFRCHMKCCACCKPAFAPYAAPHALHGWACCRCSSLNLKIVEPCYKCEREVSSHCLAAVGQVPTSHVDCPDNLQ